MTKPVIAVFGGLVVLWFVSSLVKVMSDVESHSREKGIRAAKSTFLALAYGITAIGFIFLFFYVLGFFLDGKISGLEVAIYAGALLAGTIFIITRIADVRKPGK
jgi:hypothetical protein